MVTASFYRDQATLLFKLAAATSDPIAAEQLLRLAQDYLVAIKLLEECRRLPRSRTRGRVRNNSRCSPGTMTTKNRWPRRGALRPAG
jgi:hypothetical protein